jgi:uncharacterized delta-60 repeat protein
MVSFHATTASRRIVGLILLACLALVPAIGALAAPGDQDRGFGDEGLLLTGSDFISAVLPYRGGVVEIGGNRAGDTGPAGWTVRRYDHGGVSVGSFGDGGSAVVPEEWRLSGPGAGVVEQTGRLVVVGAQIAPEGDSDRRTSTWAVVRYLSSGQPDPSFSDDGLQTIRFPNALSAAAGWIVADRQGGYLIAGGVTRPRASGGLSYDAALLRLEPDGTLHRDFGRAGKLSFRTTGAPIGLARDARGRILLAASQPDRRERATVVLYRFGTNGTRDRSFGNGGKKQVDLARPALVRDLAVAGRRPVLAATVGREKRAVIARLRPGGNFDRSFGRRGRVVVPDVRGSNTHVPAIDLDSGGRIVGAGWTGNGFASHTSAAVVRLTRTGRFDRSFGERGLTVFRVPADPLTSARVSVARDDGIFMAGTGGSFRDDATFIARLLG